MKKKTIFNEGENTIISEISYDTPLPEMRTRSAYHSKLIEMKKGGHFTITSSSRSEASIRNSVYAAIRNFKKVKPKRVYIVRKLGNGQFMVGRVE